MLEEFKIIQSLKGYLKPIVDFCDYLLHPTHIFFAIWNWGVENSFYICLFLAMFSIICKVFKIKKFSKLAPFSIGTYVFIQSIGKVIYK